MLLWDANRTTTAEPARFRQFWVLVFTFLLNPIPAVDQMHFARPNRAGRRSRPCVVHRDRVPLAHL